MGCELQNGIEQVGVNSLAVHEAEELEDAKDDRVVVFGGCIPQLSQEFPCEQSQDVMLQLWIIGVVVADNHGVPRYDFGQHLGSVLPQNQLVRVGRQTDGVGGDKGDEDLDDDVFLIKKVYMEVHLDELVVEQSVYDHHVQILFESSIVDDGFIVLFDVLEDERHDELDVWTGLDDVQH